MKHLSIDIESYSETELKTSGVYRYAEDAAFEILLLSYSVDGGEVRTVSLADGESIPGEVLDALTDDDVTKWAYNAAFERICLSRYLRDRGVSLDPFADNHESAAVLGKAQYLNSANWQCSMVWSAYLGLPLSLEQAGAALGLDKQKLTEGKDLIRYFCKPCNPTIKNGQRTRNLPHHDPEKWEAFKSYNKRDVESEMGQIADGGRSKAVEQHHEHRPTDMRRQGIQIGVYSIRRNRLPPNRLNRQRRHVGERDDRQLTGMTLQIIGDGQERATMVISDFRSGATSKEVLEGLRVRIVDCHVAQEGNERLNGSFRVF